MTATVQSLSPIFMSSIETEHVRIPPAFLRRRRETFCTRPSFRRPSCTRSRSLLEFHRSMPSAVCPRTSERSYPKSRVNPSLMSMKTPSEFWVIVMASGLARNAFENFSSEWRSWRFAAASSPVRASTSRAISSVRRWALRRL